jgi:hypothetical protein
MAAMNIVINWDLPVSVSVMAATREFCTTTFGETYMRAESWSRGQLFDGMAALSQFSGNLGWWDQLDPRTERASFANICRERADLKLFSLDKFMQSEVIQASIKEYDEKVAATAVPVVNEDY